MLTTSGVTTPGVKDGGIEQGTEEGLEEELPMDKQRLLRRLIALMNFTAQDRVEIGFAVKEVARQMSHPTGETDRAVKRLAKFLKAHPRSVCHFRWQSSPKLVRVFTDSDWAGCRKTRRSTSGGVIMLGDHMVKHWSKTQSGVALSSGEAELYAIVKGSVEAIGVKHLIGELGVEVSIELATDSNAARGAVLRSGTGRMKHVSLNTLWIQ